MGKLCVKCNKMFAIAQTLRVHTTKFHGGSVPGGSANKKVYNDILSGIGSNGNDNSAADESKKTVTDDDVDADDDNDKKLIRMMRMTLVKKQPRVMIW